jgi:hypothetical protein
MHLPVNAKGISTHEASNAICNYIILTLAANVGSIMKDATYDVSMGS